MSKNNSRYKSTNNCILTKDGKKLVLCRNHNIPDSVTEIGENAFDGCTSLQSIDIPNSVTKIGYDAFVDCIYNHRTTKTNQKYPSVNL